MAVFSAHQEAKFRTLRLLALLTDEMMRARDEGADERDASLAINRRLERVGISDGFEVTKDLLIYHEWKGACVEIRWSDGSVERISSGPL